MNEPDHLGLNSQQLMSGCLGGEIDRGLRASPM